MKKSLFALMLALMLVFTACNNGGTGGNDVDESGLTPYERLTEANEAYENSDSMAMKFNMVMDMSVDGEEFMNYVMNGDISILMESETDMKMAMDTTTLVSAMGDEQSVDLVAYYLDGYYYMEMMGEKFKMEMPMDAAFEQAAMADFNVGFEENAIKAQSANGNTLNFTLDGAYMSDMLDEYMGDMMAQFGSDASLTYGDVDYKVVLNDDNTMDSMEMICTMDISIMGETANASIEMVMSDLKVDGITIDFPADLDSYMEIDASLLGY